MTDANVLLGRIQPAFFPKVFGPKADQSLDRDVVARRFAELAQRMTSAARLIGSEDVAGGALKIAVGSMANAVKRISVMRGHDVTDYTLQCFGGAGGQHAGLVADALGMTRVFIHPLAGVLSAFGMGLADQVAMREAAVEHELDDRGLVAARAIASRLQQEAAAELKKQGLAGAALHTVSRIHIRYQGTDTALACEMPGQLPPLEALRMIREEFERSYRRRFEFVMPNHALVIEAVAVECIAPGAAAPPPSIRRNLRSRMNRRRTRMFQCTAWPMNKPLVGARHDSIAPRVCATAHVSRVRPFSPTVTQPPWSSRDGRRA